MFFLTVTSFVRQQLTTKPRYYYIGIDLGMKQDHTVIALIERTGDQLRLIHMKRPRLNSEYSDVLDYVKKLEKKFKVIAVFVDQTGVGEVFVQNANKLQVRHLKGMMMTVQSKMDIMVNLKQVMQQGRFHTPFDRELIEELNAEIARLSETGKTLFSHRSGTHDDRLWAVALAVYAARNTPIVAEPVMMLGSRPEYNWIEKGIAELATWFPGLDRLVRRDLPLNKQVPGTVERPICPICGTPYTPIPGKGKASPCGHVGEKGELTIKDEPVTVARAYADGRIVYYPGISQRYEAKSLP